MSKFYATIVPMPNCGLPLPTGHCPHCILIRYIWPLILSLSKTETVTLGTEWRHAWWYYNTNLERCYFYTTSYGGISATLFFSATTLFFQKILCCGHGAQHNIFWKNNVLWRKNKVADTCHHSIAPTTYVHRCGLLLPNTDQLAWSVGQSVGRSVCRSVLPFGLRTRVGQGTTY